MSYVLIYTRDSMLWTLTAFKIPKVSQLWYKTAYQSLHKCFLLTLSKLILCRVWVFSQCLSFTVVLSSPHEIALTIMCCYLCRSFENCSSVRTVKSCLICLKSFIWQLSSFLYLNRAIVEFHLSTAISVSLRIQVLTIVNAHIKLHIWGFS